MTPLMSGKLLGRSTTPCWPPGLVQADSALTHPPLLSHVWPLGQLEGPCCFPLHPECRSTPCKSPARIESGAAVRAGFVPLTVPLRDRHLRGGLLSWEQRALRAWTAGCWAREILEGRATTPDASEPLGLSNRYYCVLRAEGCTCPLVVNSFQEYRSLTGDLSSSSSVSHAFPSESEPPGCTLAVLTCPFIVPDGF